MKALLSILLVLILLFSLCGYRLVIDVLQEKAEAELTAQIDIGVDDEDLISLKVPVSLPYYTNSKDFQYISGEVQLEGSVYQYVKRRIYNDTIEYLCIQNKAKTKLLSAREQFYQLAYDLQLNKTKSSKQHKEVKPLMLEYCSVARLSILPAYVAASKSLPSIYLHPLAVLALPGPAQPPERA